DGETPVSDPSTGMFFDLEAHALAFRGIEAGDAIALEYSIRPIVRENPLERYYADVVLMGSELPTQLERYMVTAPEALPLYFSQERVEPPSIRKSASAVTRIWEGRNLPALSREPNGPGWMELAAHVHVSNFASWTELGQWYSALLAPQLKLNAELEAAAQQIAKDHATTDARVSAVLDFVVQNTRYVGLEFGIFGLKPHAVTDTYAKGFGDCKDKASLMIAMLRSMGIEGRLALLRTQSMGEIATA